MNPNLQLLAYGMGLVSSGRPLNYEPLRPIWKAPPTHASKHRHARAARAQAKRK